MTARTLLTGGVGFLGSAVAAQTWMDGEASDWLLLVRAGDEDTARSRIRTAMGTLMPADQAARAADAFGVFAGDLESLASTDDPRVKGVERIVHLAANTSFTTSGSVWLANFDGTMALGRAARRMDRLERFLHVGTAFRCGAEPGVEELGEVSPPGPDSPHIVDYTRSKAAAETALRASFPNLPIVVALPSIVAGHSDLGCGPGASIFWFFRTLDRMGMAPRSPSTWIDVTPADWTARALLHLLRAPSLAHATYHVSAGRASRTSLGQMAARFGELGHGSGLPWTEFRMNEGPGGWAEAEMAFRTAFPVRDAIGRTMLGGVQKYCRFVDQGLTFLNDRLLETGMAPSPPLVDYMEACLRIPGSDVREMFMDDAVAFGFPATSRRDIRAA